MKSLILTVLATLFLMGCLFAEPVVMNGNANQVQLVISDDSQSVMHFTMGTFDRVPVAIGGNTYYQLHMKNEALTYDKGYPEVPTVSRSIIVAGNAKYALRVTSSQYVEYAMAVAPSKGTITRDINPDTVPYTFSEIYDQNTSYPANIAYLSDPFILRDYRGITVTFQPFVFNPKTGILRVYTDIMVKVENVGFDTINTLSRTGNRYSPDFETIYQNQFLNFNPTKYTPVNEIGKLLVICPTAYMTTIQPYVNWKRQKGITTDLVELSTIGTTATAVQSFIQTRYTQDNSLTFVQLVGDAAQMPSMSSGGGGSDPSYSLVAGSDSYPDIFIGRFSAETTAQLQTQVDRTIYYERDMPATASWLNKGMGIASMYGGGSQGDNGESDQVHIENLRTDLTAYNYHTLPTPGTSTVDQVYENNGATIAQVSNGLNAGRSIVDYCGHGSDTSWGTTGFANSNVSALTNDNMLPFIFSVACVNGNFTNQTCFAEAWLRSTHNNNPVGAIATYMSSINQSWNSPMRAQDEFIDLLTQSQKFSIGGLFYNASCKMIEVYSADGISMFKTWHIFGDASLQVRTNVPVAMTVTHDPALVIGMNTFTVNTGVPGALVSLTNNGLIYGASYTDAGGQAVLSLTNPPQTPVDLTLTVTATNKVTNVSTVQMIAGSGPYIVLSGATISDGNNHQADLGESFFWNLSLSNVGSEDASNITATVSTTDEFVTVLNGTANVSSIIPQGNAVLSNAIRLQVSNTVPDQHVASLHVVITNADNTTWTYDPTITINAPAFQYGSLLINDTQGNNNGRVDAGETVLLTIPITNSGHTNASATSVSLETQATNIVIQPMDNTFSSVAVNGSVNATFQVTFSSQIQAGSHEQIICSATSGSYTLENTLDVVVGMVMEDFESGTMTAYPWSFTGGNWTNATSGAYAGTHCAKSPTVANSSSASMQVTLTVPTSGSISFYSKTSSEANYDYLKFFINNVQQEQWSGEAAWAQHTYSVGPGQVTFKWQYIKDGSSVSGSDCAWLDNIVFPVVGGTQGTPSFAVSTQNMPFGQVTIASHAVLPITITNNGNTIMLGTITGSEIFKIAPTETTDASTEMSYVIAAGESETYDVIFTPAEQMIYNQQVTITSDDQNHSSTAVNVSGEGMPVGNNDPHVIPAVTELIGNYPNPFNPETSISFSLKERTNVNVAVYNVLGQKVKTLVNGELPAGMNHVRWDGKDDNGKSVGSGVYFTKMEAGRYTSTKKMIMLK
ncbi:MAG TPA: C25 family cysteine peptidase [Candidatus Cloacimonadota bacterium]|nr:C25 family cysteine peptidase [Candidatus Cloacimonadota bacterium]HPT71255.1 C25 family cysteine peptidase [Candidatus Cloacimonadota bacterium]